MANLDLFLPKLLKHEGGYVNDPNDPGGATKFGVTLKTWQLYGHDITGDGKIDEKDIQQLSTEDFKIVVKVLYWNRWQADLIKNQSIAEILVDWLYNSGSPGIKIPQRLVGLKEDGVVGKITINAINTHDQNELHDRIVNARHQFYQEIIQKNPKLKKFEKGWLKRLYSYKFVQ